MEQEPEVQVTEPEAAAPIAEPVPPDVIPAWEAEIDCFWQNIFVNVSSKVDTPTHNYLLTEIEALKARLKSLF